MSTLRGMAGLLGAVVLLAGCDRLPWGGQKHQQPESTASTATSASVTSTTTQAPAEAAPIDPYAHERVALVNQGAITTTDLELTIDELKRFAQANGQTWEPLSTEQLPNSLDLQDLMDSLVVAELKSQDAQARGLGRDRKVARHLAALIRNFYAQEWERWQRERSAPSDDEIHRFYEQNKMGFVDPERLHVRQLVTETRDQAEAVRARVVQGEGFEQLARELSVGAGKDKGGDVGWYLRATDAERLSLIGKTPTESVFFPKLEPFAFAIEPGDISQPVQGPDGHYYLLQLIEKQPSRQQTELEVRDDIKEFLTLQSMQQKLEQLRKQAAIKTFPERLAGVGQ